MSTQKQKKIADLIIENTNLDKPLNGGEMLEKVGYSDGLQKHPDRVLSSEGVKQALEVAGFNEVNAKTVVSEIMLDPTNDPSSRLKATDQVFKVNGSYAPEKNINLNLNGEIIPNEELQSLAKQLNDIARNNTRTSVSSDGTISNVVDTKI